MSCSSRPISWPGPSVPAPLGGRGSPVLGEQAVLSLWRHGIVRRVPKTPWGSPCRPCSLRADPVQVGPTFVAPVHGSDVAKPCLGIRHKRAGGVPAAGTCLGGGESKASREEKNQVAWGAWVGVGGSVLSASAFSLGLDLGSGG